MYRLTSKLIIYRGIGEDSILRCLAEICRRFDEGDYDREAMIEEIYEQLPWSPRRSAPIRAASMPLRSMISGSSGNCSTTISAK